MKGMDWMFKFLKKKNYARLYELGDDMPSIFFECWYTSADSRIRTHAKGIAKVLVGKLEKHRVAQAEAKIKDGEVLDRDDFFEFMFLLRCKHEMNMDCDVMLRLASISFKQNNFRDTYKLLDVKDLESINTDNWLLVLMRVLIMDYNNILFQNKFPLQWGLKECFMAIREHELVTWKSEPEEYDDAFYLATHIVFAISAYSAVKTEQKDAPWLYSYIRGAFKFWLKKMKIKEKEDPDEYVDIDAVGEILDNLRGVGLTDGSDPMVCEASVWLLKQQKKNGQFPVWFRNEGKHDNYDKIHSTWVCTQALRDRDFKIKENQKWIQWMDRVLIESKFGTLAYKPKWKVKRFGLKK